jgi:hypothetical protein
VKTLTRIGVKLMFGAGRKSRSTGFGLLAFTIKIRFGGKIWELNKGARKRVTANN